ncbi:ABC transporter permease [bacterium]|jgi:putative ABC transport system permease protein|nr:ABC transporter permease [bacterium]
MIWEMLLEAWHSMGANRMRTFLTMLGMIIGVGAVILMLAIGQGVQQKIKESIDSMGSNLFIVLSGSTTAGGLRAGSGATPTLTVADAQSIGELPDVLAVAPTVRGTAQIVYGANNWSTAVYGTTPGYFEARAWSLSEGYLFSDSDVRSGTRLAVVGKTVVDNLFNGEDPVGKTIRINQSPFLVVGVLAPKGQNMDGRDQDDSVIIPVTTAQRQLFGSVFQGTVRFIMVQTVSAEVMSKVHREIEYLLRRRHHIQDNMDDDFTIRNLTAMADAAAETTKMLSFMLGAIASISLVVGGIGIMNIMLVSVTERTREIGIRISIGARERDILLQFLFEAVMISVIGCFIGVGVGIGGALIVSRFFDLTVVVTGASILLSFGVAGAIGVFFGFYPARKAARLEPIEALRYQ